LIAVQFFTILPILKGGNFLGTEEGPGIRVTEGLGEANFKRAAQRFLIRGRSVPGIRGSFGKFPKFNPTFSQGTHL